MPKFLTPINLNQLELQKAVIENYAGNPNGAVSGVDGQILWDSTNDKLYLCTGGTTWVVSSGEIVDTNTTYSISAETSTGGVNLRLTAASPSNTDDVKFANGNAILISRTDDSTITIAHADTSTITGLQGGNGISSVTVDGDGHVTAVGTTTYVTSVGATAPVASSGGATPTISMAAATASVDGYMTSTYASKLDGIASGAEVNQNAFNTIAVSGQSDVVADSKTDTLTLVAGTNVAITTNSSTDTITITSTDTNWYPTTFAWTGGTTAGPTGSLTGTGMSAVSYAAIPSATGSASGVVTTDTQTFAGDKTFNNNVVVAGNLTVNGTTTTINSNVQTFDDPVITLGGDSVAVETAMSRGVEFKHNGTALTMTNFIGNASTTVTGTVASTAGFASGDMITISGATGTEQAKLNGTWKIVSVPNGTTFTFIVATSVAAGTLTTNLGATVKAKNGFMGYNQSSGRFSFIPQANNTGEVFTGTPGIIDISQAVFSGSTSGTITLVPTAVAGTTTLTMPATTGTLALTSQIPTVNDGTLTLQTGVAAATNNTVTVSSGTGFSANASANSTYELRVGPALTALAAQMTGAGAGFLRKNGADTFSLDTTSYLSGTVTPANGGTGLSTVTTVGELYAGNTTSLMTRIAPVAAGSVLVSNGVAAAPVYSANPVVTSMTAANYYGSSAASGSAKYSSTSHATKGTTEIGDSNAGTATVQGATVNIKVGAASSGGVLTVAATTGAVTVDTASYAKKYSVTLSTSATSYTVTHNLNTRDVTVSVFEVGSPYAQVYCDIEATTVNTITVKFAVAPAINTYRVVVIG